MCGLLRSWKWLKERTPLPSSDDLFPISTSAQKNILQFPKHKLEHILQVPTWISAKILCLKAKSSEFVTLPGSLLLFYVLVQPRKHYPVLSFSL